jgi:hypothetical protein
MGIDFIYPGMAETIRYYHKLFDGARITPSIKRVAEKTMSYGLDLIKKATPVDTGRLQRGWSASLKAHGIEWKNEVEYGIYLEMGTIKMQARAMIESSLPLITKYFNKELAKELGRSYARKILGEAEPDVTSYENLTSGTRETQGFRGKRQS